MNVTRVVAALAVALLAGCTVRDPVVSPSPRETPSPEATASVVEECTGVAVTPSDDLQQQIDRYPNGTVFCLSKGTYRMTEELIVKARQELIGMGTREAIISGARVITAQQEGSYWVVTGLTSLGDHPFSGTSDQCRPVDGVDPQGMCVYKDQVFLDDVSLWQVGSRSGLSAGEFFWDYGANKIYLADDPTGRTLEVSVAGTRAIHGEVGVVIHNLVVEKFGNGPQGGAVSASTNWFIADSDIRLNHGAGVHMGPGTVLRDNYIHHNGQLGIHGGQAPCSKAKGLIAEGNEIAYNNAAGYNWGFEGGATKWLHTDGLIVRGNYVHHNYGMGLWTDGANINVLYEDNRVEDNHGMGIDHELGQSAVIRNNEVRRNGFAHPIQGDAWGAGIFIDQARDVEVYGNIVEDNAAGITAVQEPAGSVCGYQESEVVNLHVYDNVVRQPTGIAAGLTLVGESDTSYLDPIKNNRWEDNSYQLGVQTGPHFSWANEGISAEEWRSRGMDREGTFTPLS